MSKKSAHDPGKERCSLYLLFVVFVSALGGFLYGYHTGIISGALMFLTPAFQLSTVKQGLLVSMILMGALVSAAFSGTIADKIGRRRTIALTTIFFITGSIILALSESYFHLILGRLISGIGLGLVSLAVPMYLAEVSPSRFRGAFVSGYQLAVSAGMLASFIVNYLFSYSANWRWMFAIGVFPAAFQVAALFFMPETPPWLFKIGRDDRAKETLEKLRKDKEWMKEVPAMMQSASQHKKHSWKTLWAPKLRWILVIGLLLSVFQQITGINAVFYYAPKIFQEAGFASEQGAILATMSLGTINVLVTAFAAWMLDKAGRRLMLLLGGVGMALCLAFLSLAFFTESKEIDLIAILGLLSYVAFFAIGLGPVTFVVISEIYPLKVRGKAMTVAVLVNWACNIIVSFTFLDLVKNLGTGLTFLVYAFICLLSIAFVYRYLPETKGKSLEEIEADLL